MKILVTGVNGQLGYDVCKVLTERGLEHCGVDITDFDITDERAVKDYLIDYHPDAVIHCSAWTAVDAAEDQPEKAVAINVGGVRNIASACKVLGAKLVYISTDYVFSGFGDHFYEVDDETGPLSVYGKTKLDGEMAVKELLSCYFIVRISWAFGVNGNNFVKTMLRLAERQDEVSVVCDQFGSPTYTADLAPLLCDMIETSHFGTYHATNEGICSWAEFAAEIFKLAGRAVKVNEIMTCNYPTKAVRPLNSRLSKDKLVEAGFSRLPHWREALSDYMEVLGATKQNLG
ncbi:dTDP-4-dehydrorhamnose reductase [Desulfitobacterium hafniense DCB-2]|uniref:dTDP-4-dehydrorhamnose reductase n=1 Tax=Desulfitobacterium hafniense (strain DSM 10664 / DCB-2) TaxID=272564 RepID=B8FVR8_DESHD|nr:dTDP-4-dehydrorhamnose reductase [Desulfitobacterium hafniense]ACL22470.1 dTDP-4-dehydrorhamnose reductase [Desulfitobacterium hafniense DCB-2]